MHTKERPWRLAIRADDFGVHPACDRAILRLIRAGYPLNVSVQANGPSLPRSAADLAQTSDVCVGLHLTLTCEWVRPVLSPVLPPYRLPRLMRGGGLPGDLREFLRRGVTPAEITAEADMQLDCLRGLGLEPRYADVHMGVHRGGPELYRAISGWAVGRGLKWIDELPRLPGDASTALASRFRAAADRGGVSLLVLHPGTEEASPGMMLRSDPSLDVGLQRTHESALAEQAIRAATRDPSVELCRLDTV